jgi:predicted TIM-barrel fold metal-dependent hydrolase
VMPESVEHTDAGVKVIEAAGVRLTDGDSHYYEPIDALTRHLDPALARRLYRFVTTAEGQTRLVVNGRVIRMVTDPTFDPLALPGSLHELFRQGGDANYRSAFEVKEPLDHHPEFTTRAARLRKMDEQGVGEALLFPTLAVCIEQYLDDQPELTSKALVAFNRWLEDDWGYNYCDQLHAVPLISLIDPEAAEVELLRVLGLGARMVHLRPCPVPGAKRGRSLVDPAFRRFWSIANEAGITIAFHLSDGGQFERFAADWGEESNPPPTAISRFHLMSAYRSAYDTLADVLLHGFFDSFDQLRVYFVELGAEWIQFFLKNLMKNAKRIDYAELTTSLDPVSTFHKHVYVSPYPEEDVHGLLEYIHADRLVFGSDYPHVEGLARPDLFFDELGDLPSDVLQKIGGANARSLLSPPRL